MTKKNPRGHQEAPDELKIEAFEDYCAYIAKGKGRRGWRWRKDNRVRCTYETVEKWLKERPDLLDSINKKMALADSYDVWEEIARNSAKGVNKEANTASLNMVMRNMFGWDKPDKESTTINVQMPSYKEDE